MYYTIIPSREEQIYAIDSIFSSGFGRLEFGGNPNGSNDDESNDSWGSGDDSVPSLMSYTTADRIMNWIENPTNKDVRSAWIIQIAWRCFKMRRDERSDIPVILR